MMEPSKQGVGDFTFEEQRLKTFKDWPFKETSSCNASRVAEAGFFFCGSNNEPDLVQCYVCLKKLDGWEEGDDPWKEHERHASSCLFVKIRKRGAELTAYNHLDLCRERTINLKKAEYAEQRAQLFEVAKEVREKIVKLRKLKK